MSPRAQKPPTPQAAQKRDATKHAVSKSPVLKDTAPKKDVIKKEGMKKEGMKKEAMKKEASKSASKVETSKPETSKNEVSKSNATKTEAWKAVATAQEVPKVPDRTVPTPLPEPAAPLLRQDGSTRPPPSAKQLEDKALVQRARTGDQLAFNELVKRHRHGVERLIRPMVRSASSDEVEDLVQEALTKAMLHLTSYSEDYAFSTWLYRIATNHAIDYLRRRKLNAFSISAPPMGLASRHEDEGKEYEISDSSWVPDDVLLSGERTNLIEAAIDQLPENYRRIIRLRHNDDMEYEEIAQVLKLPMGTVKVHLHRARAALARMLEGKI